MAACGRCGNRAGHDPIAEAQCELLSVLRRGVVAASARLDQPAPEVAVLDLFAHLRAIYEDGTLAYRAACQVLELGWRPVVGGYMAELVLCQHCELGMPRGQLLDHWCDGRLAAAERGRRLLSERGEVDV